MNEDYILNGTAHGSVATRLINSGGDLNVFRPFVGRNGKSYTVRNVRGKDGKVKNEAILTSNADATLRHEEWLQIDETVQQVARERLNIVEDLRSAGLTYNIPNGMGKTVLLTEKSSDTNDALMSMDGLRESENDRQVYDSDYLPLPIIHKDFHFSARQIAASRNGNTPIDTSMVAEATRKVAEMAEKLVIGSATFPTYGGGTIYGLTNYTNALTESLSDPSTGGSSMGANALADILSMKQSAQNAHFYGPYMVYNAPAWDQYLDNDFKAASDKSVRQRLSEVAGISGIKTLDFLSNYDMIMVQMTSNVIREVIGMDIVPLQWETKGGMRVNFKVMAIMVPQLRADYNDNTGIVYGSV